MALLRNVAAAISLGGLAMAGVAPTPPPRQTVPLSFEAAALAALNGTASHPDATTVCVESEFESLRIAL